jgi:prepilin-type N-terminal cleavage/methylation domain-containing protein
MTCRKQGFSLIELMIVIMLLAIVSAITIPRFVDASDDARETAIETDIQMMRRQIMVYVAQHTGKGPHLDENGNLDKANLAARLTGRTDPEGKLGATGLYGPYMAEWPTNPFIASADNAAAVTFGTDTSPPRDDSTGWYYNTDTCIISANSSTGGAELDPQP